jgi:hypothetical protein
MDPIQLSLNFEGFMLKSMGPPFLTMTVLRRRRVSWGKTEQAEVHVTYNDSLPNVCQKKERSTYF